MTAGIVLSVATTLPDPIDDPPLLAATPAAIARGEYLARAGDCAACHTARGGVPYAGGRGIATPFGTVYASNLTPDDATGLGRWSAAQFHRALHRGMSADGRLLYPVFPYPNYSRITREDSDAIFHYLRSLPPARQPNLPHALAFPYSTQWALRVWRWLFFRAAEPAQANKASPDRGEYLVQVLGHCNACHASRNLLGATPGPDDLGGGVIPVQNWYAPALTSPQQAGLAHWREADIIELLKTGINAERAVIGPMAEVVRQSTQYLSDEDLRAIAVYLRSLPQIDSPRHISPIPPVPDAQGEKLYARHCADCHGAQGEGVSRVYAKLASSRSVQMDPPANLIRMVVGGGFPPATAGNPRPYGMPPFATVLNDNEIAAVLSYVRASWGNTAPPVTALEVARYRSNTGNR